MLLFRVIIRASLHGSMIFLILEDRRLWVSTIDEGSCQRAITMVAIGSEGMGAGTRVASIPSPYRSATSEAMSRLSSRP